MRPGLLTTDFKAVPYWHDRTPAPELGRPTLPERVDVVVIGAGYTGLCAAIQTARGGRSTLVLDAADAGWGCSTRNGGQISTSVKPSFDELARKHGRKTAFRIIKEGHNALAWIEAFTAEEGIDCDFAIPGRFHAAHNPRQYERMTRAIKAQPEGLEVRAHAVSRAEQHHELGTDAYFGGVVFEQHASVDPARLHRGLLNRARLAGAVVVPHCAVSTISREGHRFSLTTAGGRVLARDVVIATNGYTGTATPWMRRRVIPIGSYVIATEPLPKEVMDRVMPTNRIASDSRRVVHYYRPSPDRTRIVFGGRVTSGETTAERSGALLHRNLVAIFPELAGTRISHSWMGFVAYTFDTLAHVGQHDGIYYAMGYCGSGVSMASYLGTRVGQQVLELKEGRTALDGLDFPTRPLYSGKPWFLPAAVAWYRFLDRLPI